MLPLLRAAKTDGPDVAFATDWSFADALSGVPLLDVGPGVAELSAEAIQRDGGLLAIGPGNMTGQTILDDRDLLEAVLASVASLPVNVVVVPRGTTALPT